MIDRLASGPPGSDAQKACAPLLGYVAGMVGIVIFALGAWQSIVLPTTVNTLVFLHDLTGDLGLAILALGSLMNGSSLLLRTPSLLAEQRRWERMRVGSTIAVAPISSWPANLRPVLTGSLGAVGLVLVFALFWSLSRVFLPDTAIATNLERYLWPALGLRSAPIDVYFMYVDLRQVDRILLPASRIGLPGIFLLTNIGLGLLYQYLKNRTRQRYGIAMLPRRSRASVYWLGVGLSVLVGWLLPAGVLLYWLTTVPFNVLSLWLFPLAEVND